MDLNYWENCCKQELEQLRKFVKENNFDLDIGERIEEREAQKHLDDLSEDLVNFLRGVNEEWKEVYKYISNVNWTKTTFVSINLTTYLSWYFKLFFF